MKQIIFPILTFIAVFIVSLLAFFPYDRIVKQELDKAIGANNIPITYTDVSSGPFSTTLYGVQVTKPQEADLGDVKLSYSPLSILTRKATANIDNGFGKAVIVHKGSAVHLDADLDVDRISRLAGEEAAGLVKAVVDYDYAEQTGTFTLSSGALQAKTPMMTVNADSLSGNGSIAGNVITIAEIKTEGTAGVNLKGVVQLDMKNVIYSMLNLEGEGSIMGMKSAFTLTGRLNAPRFNLK
jgi:hypothetical protein